MKPAEVQPTATATSAAVPPAAKAAAQEQVKAAEKKSGSFGKGLLGVLFGIPVGVIAGLKFVPFDCVIIVDCLLNFSTPASRITPN